MVTDKAASSLPEVNDSTTLRILDAVRTKQAISRADLARLLNLAPSTVSQKVSELLDEGLLEEQGQATTRAGRPPRILKAPNSRTCYATVDLGTSHARYGYSDLNQSLSAPLTRRKGRHTLSRRSLPTFAKISQTPMFLFVLQGYVFQFLRLLIPKTAGLNRVPISPAGVAILCRRYSQRPWVSQRSSSTMQMLWQSGSTFSIPHCVTLSP